MVIMGVFPSNSKNMSSGLAFSINICRVRQCVSVFQLFICSGISICRKHILLNMALSDSPDDIASTSSLELKTIRKLLLHCASRRVVFALLSHRFFLSGIKPG